MAAALACGIASDSVPRGGTGGARKNVVENNSLSLGHDVEELEKEHGDSLSKVYNIARPRVLTKMASRFLELLVLALGQFRFPSFVIT